MKIVSAFILLSVLTVSSAFAATTLYDSPTIEQNYGSLQFGDVVTFPGGTSYVEICSSNGTSCTSVQVIQNEVGPDSYAVEQQCDYGTGCRQVPVYTGRTMSRCSYGPGCTEVPLKLPPSQVQCNYGNGCELFPIF